MLAERTGRWAVEARAETVGYFVNVSGGTVDVALGRMTPLTPALFERPTHLAVRVGGAELTPRQEVGAFRVLKDSSRG